MYCHILASQVYGVGAVTQVTQMLRSRARIVCLWALALHRCLTKERLDTSGILGAQGTSWSNFEAQESLMLLKAHGSVPPAPPIPNF